MALARHLALLNQQTFCKSVTVFFATRSSRKSFNLGAQDLRSVLMFLTESLGWFKGAFESTIAGAGSHLDFDVQIFITSMDAATASEGLSAMEPKPSQSSSSASVDSNDKETPQSTINITGGRPNLSAIVDEHMGQGGTLGVAACGPETLTSEVRNAVAKGQLRIAGGVTQMKECFLHTEGFGW